MKYKYTERKYQSTFALSQKRDKQISPCDIQTHLFLHLLNLVYSKRLVFPLKMFVFRFLKGFFFYSDSGCGIFS